MDANCYRSIKLIRPHAIIEYKFLKTTIIYNYSLDNNNQMVYNIIHKYILGRNTMTRSELIKIICQKNNISLSELARRIGQTPQNFNKKILRNTISDDELSKILLVLNIEYEQKIRFSDGTSIEMKTD